MHTTVLAFCEPADAGARWLALSPPLIEWMRNGCGKDRNQPLFRRCG
jgi:hypothetical protein